MVQYPSFSRRLGAWMIDGLILFALAMPVALRGIWSLDFGWAAAATVGFGLLFYLYKIITQAVWGKTVGKSLLGIQLRMKNDAPVKWPAVLIRYLPGLAYASVHATGWLLMVRSAGWAKLQELPPAERGQLIGANAPFWWPRPLMWTMMLWLLLNAIVLRNSSQNRALHDLIAGTTVRAEDR